MKKLIGSSPQMERMREDILDLGQAEGHILIDGETGTGKTLVAHALHAVGPNPSRSFVILFLRGHRRGQPFPPRSFGPTDDSGRLPLIEGGPRRHARARGYRRALSHALQGRLLAWINDQGTPPETRVIAISNLQEQGKTCEDVLRPDLFYRLALDAAHPSAAPEPGERTSSRCSLASRKPSPTSTAATRPTYLPRRPHSFSRHRGPATSASSSTSLSARCCSRGGAPGRSPRS